MGSPARLSKEHSMARQAAPVAGLLDISAVAARRAQRNLSFRMLDARDKSTRSPQRDAETGEKVP